MMWLGCGEYLWGKPVLWKVLSYLNLIQLFTLLFSMAPMMEYSWPLLLLLALVSAAVAFLFSAIATRRSLPPGPTGLPFLGNPFLFGKPFATIAPTIHRLRSIYGPIITFPIPGCPFIFIADRASAHRTLIAAGTAFAGRPVTSVSQYAAISSAGYGPAWRLLRRNLTSEVLQPARIKYYADARAWALDLLLGKLAAESEAGGCVRVGPSFQFTMFSLFTFMCFGEKMDEKQVRKVEKAQREVLAMVISFNLFSFLPKYAKLLYWKRWNENQAARRRQADVLLPLIKARMDKHDKDSCSYVDSLVRLEIPEEGGRKLTEGELVLLCSELFNAGIDTTATTFQWVMANLVKHPEIQRKLAEEIELVMEEKGDGGEYVGEEDLQKMKYLRAVVMETLRRHPPLHFVLPHAVVEEVEMDGYVIPKVATVNFAVAEMGRDGEVWKEPMEFRPERFLEEEVDITGTKEIKMMPFGAGRRMCPGIGLAMLNLEWFVANLVREYEWKTKDDEEVDLAEKAEAAVVMKKPLEAIIVPRKKKI